MYKSKKLADKVLGRTFLLEPGFKQPVVMQDKAVVILTIGKIHSFAMVLIVVGLGSQLHVSVADLQIAFSRGMISEAWLQVV